MKSSMTHLPCAFTTINKRRKYANPFCIIISIFLQHYLKDTCMAPTLSQSQNDGRRFRFRSTQTNVRRQQQETRRQWGVSDSLARSQQAHHSQARFFAQRNRGVANRERRRFVKFTSSTNKWYKNTLKSSSNH